MVIFGLPISLDAMGFILSKDGEERYNKRQSRQLNLRGAIFLIRVVIEARQVIMYEIYIINSKVVFV